MPPMLITEGAFAGWHRWRDVDQGRFQDLVGPVYFRRRDDGVVDCRSETGRQHSNMADMLHGGYIMTFIDQALYAMAADHLETHRAVTVTCTTDFVGAGIPGRDILAHGEVVRAAGSMIFLRGTVTQRGEDGDSATDRVVAAFSAVLKKVAPRT